MNWNVHFQIKNGSNNRFSACSENEDNARLSFFCVFFSPFFFVHCAFYIFIWCFGRRMFSTHMENFVEFRLNDRNSTLKLNVSQTIFVLHMHNVCSEWMDSGVRMNLIHWMQNPFVNENVCQCESGNLMTCRGLIRPWLDSSLLLSIWILHLFIPHFIRIEITFFFVT